jgi:hypothetical protein
MTELVKIWSVQQMDCYPILDGNEDVVSTVRWMLSATQGNHFSSIDGIINFPVTNLSSFVPFADLTEETVIGWVKSQIGAEQVAGYEAAVAAQIEALVNPPVVTPDLPWAG